MTTILFVGGPASAGENAWTRTRMRGGDVEALALAPAYASGDTVYGREL